MVREHCAIWLKHVFVYGVTVGGGGGVIQNSLMSLGGQEENVSNKENCPGPFVIL